MQETRRDRAAEEVVESAIRNMFGDAVDRIVVGQTEDPYGEPALFVTIYMKAAQERMSGSQLLDAITEASTALREIEDYRFPYVTFLAPEELSEESFHPTA
jgi:hypothetical protein